MKNYKIYIITDRHTNQTVYVGLTRQTLHKRFLQHVGSKKCTHSQHRIELVLEELSLAEAVTLEKMLIDQYDTIAKGLNKSPGSINGSSNYHSEAQKAKWSKERKGQKVDTNHADKNRTARLGHTNSKSHNDKIAAKVSKSIICLNNGKVYLSARAAAKDLNLSYCRISEVANGKRPHTKGYKFKFLPINSL